MLISVRQAAVVANLSPEYVRLLLRRGVLGGVKIGSYWAVEAASLAAWLSARKVEG